MTIDNVKQMASTNKYNLTDVSFVVPIRIDSEERRSNLKALLKVLIRDFNTHIIILEADKTQHFLCEQTDVEYHFVYDVDPVFHRTKYINQLLGLTTTPIVGVWDADAIGIPLQICEAVEKIRNQTAVMAFPYDGLFYCADNILSAMFRQTMQYEVLTENIALMNLMHGYYAVGGAYLVNKEKYTKVGGENENFYGWGPEDAERVWRMEIYDLPIYFTSGLLFHLWHPRRGWFDNIETEMQNRKELLKVCKMRKVTIMQ